VPNLLLWLGVRQHSGKAVPPLGLSSMALTYRVPFTAFGNRRCSCGPPANPKTGLTRRREGAKTERESFSFTNQGKSDARSGDRQAHESPSEILWRLSVLRAFASSREVFCPRRRRTGTSTTGRPVTFNYPQVRRKTCARCTRQADIDSGHTETDVWPHADGGRANGILGCQRTSGLHIARCTVGQETGVDWSGIFPKDWAIPFPWHARTGPAPKRLIASLTIRMLTKAAILAGHFEATRRRFAASPGPFSCWHDTTELSFQRIHPEKIGKTRKVPSGRRMDGSSQPHTVCGLLMHSSLVVTSDGLPLGIAASKFWTRKKFKGTNALKKKINPTRWPIREISVRWIDNLRQFDPVFGGTRTVACTSRSGSDIYELLLRGPRTRYAFPGQNVRRSTGRGRPGYDLPVRCRGSGRRGSIE